MLALKQAPRPAATRGRLPLSNRQDSPKRRLPQRSDPVAFGVEADSVLIRPSRFWRVAPFRSLQIPAVIRDKVAPTTGDFHDPGDVGGAFTVLHVVITLVAIGSGLIVVGGIFASHKLPVTTALFLFTTALTSVTGFLFPIHGFTPALGVGIVACVILAVALFALYKEHLVGAWRWIYVITAVASLYLNVFVLVVQSFVKVSVLNALAPTQSEPPFAITQAVVLAIFILITLIAVVKFRPGTTVRV